MTYKQVLHEIEDLIETHGSARALAKRWGISPMYLCDLRRGRRQPGPLVLKAMELEVQTTYHRVYRRIKS